MRAAALFLTLAPALAFCETPIPPSKPASQDPAKWSFQLTPYVWATGVGGTFRPITASPTVTFDRSFGDVLEDLNSAFFLSAYAQRGKFVILGDLSYSDASHTATVNGIPGRAGLRQTSLTLAGGYRVTDQEDAKVDSLFGFRSWKLKSSIESPVLGVQLSPEKSFTDAIIGARALFPLSDQWSILLYGDVGIFRLGSRSTAQIVGTANYTLNKDVVLSFGYRQLNVDYRSGGTVVDATLSGLLIGATWKF